MDHTCEEFYKTPVFYAKHYEHDTISRYIMESFKINQMLAIIPITRKKKQNLSVEAGSISLVGTLSGIFVMNTLNLKTMI